MKHPAKQSARILSLAAVLTASALQAQAAQVLVNGDFESGLTGWTSYVTANGTIAEIPSTPTETHVQVASVASFNVTGASASNALFLNAGVVNPPYGLYQQGGGVWQKFTTTGGKASFSADIAAYTRANSLSIGLVSVILDGVVKDSYDFGDANNTTLRGTLNFSEFLTAGEHLLSLQATRRFAPARGVTSQYFDNVSLNISAVPELSTWALMLTGLVGLGCLAQRRRRASVAA